MADVVFGARWFGDVELNREDTVLAPSLRVFISRTFEVEQAADIGGGRLRWTQGGVAASPLLLAFARSLGLRLCAGGSVGIVEIEGIGVSDAQSRTRPWASVDATGRLAWTPIPALLLELEAGLLAPVFRETFFFSPAVSVYEAPALTWTGRAGAAMRFP